MGSVISDIECPNCHSPYAYNDYYYKTGEEFTICSDCGYYFAYEIDRDEKSDNLSFKTTIIDKPYGSYSISGIKSGGGMMGSLESKDQLDEIINAYREKIEPVVSIKLSRYINGEIFIKEVFNTEKYLRIKKLKKISNL